MQVINNCDELLTYLTKDKFFDGFHEFSCGGYLQFQGNMCEVDGFMPDRWCTLMPSIKFPKTVFAIDDYDPTDKEFMLYIYKGEEFVLDQTLAIKLPSCIKDELIATIQGYK